ncbi:MAG: hypothetical protein J2P25_10275 [Nocardiopsaceae bacterium]|nr:hypothetical protein [Nocardiopsaceae bacterium]
MLDTNPGRIPSVSVVHRIRKPYFVLAGICTLIFVLFAVGFWFLSANIRVLFAAGLFFVFSIITWRWALQGGRFEVSRDMIVTRRSRWGKPRESLARGDVDTLLILPGHTLFEGCYSAPRLIALGTGRSISIDDFRHAPIRSACEAQGWRFDGDTALAVHDVRGLLRMGLPNEAARLIELYGPFPAAAADDDPGVSLEAAVYRAIADDPKDASRPVALERADAAQRAFTPMS